MLLQQGVDSLCKSSGKRSCQTTRGGLMSTDSASACRKAIFHYMKNRACEEARWKVNNKCFRGGDEIHRMLARAAGSAADACWLAIMRSPSCQSMFRDQVISVLPPIEIDYSDPNFLSKVGNQHLGPLDLNNW